VSPECRQLRQLDELSIGALLDVVADRIAKRVVEQFGPGAGEPSEPDPWHLLDVEAVGAMLGRSKRWVHGAVKERGLPHIRLDGGALAFDPDDVRAWARARRVPAEAPETLGGRWETGRKPAPRLTSDDGRRTVMQKVGAP
jgi:hypothetical protein